MRTVGTRRDPGKATTGIDVVLSHLRNHDLIRVGLRGPRAAAHALDPMIFARMRIEIMRKSAS
jgi:hypothetical protein